MLYKIENSGYSAEISSLGAELKSFKKIDTGDEIIWGGDPAIWNGNAPILFPIVGGLKNDRLDYKGKSYTCPKHGVVRRREFEMINCQDGTVTFEIQSNAEIIQEYPFQFSLKVTFSIMKNGLKIGYTVENLDTEEMIFTIGSHPAFNLPMTDDISLNDYYIEFEKSENLGLYTLDGTLVKPDPVPYLKDEKKISLHDHIFDEDALIFKNIISRFIYIKNRKTTFCVKVDTGGAPHLGIWAKPSAPYVCVEPWYGLSDSVDSDCDLTKKTDMMRLQPAGKFETYISFEDKEQLEY